MTPVRRLLAADSIYAAGNGMWALTTVFWAWELTGNLVSPALIATGFAAGFYLSGRILLPRVLGRGFDQRRIVATGYAVHACIVLIAAFTSWRALATIPLLMLLDFSNGLQAGTSGPSSVALRKAFTPDDRLVRTNAEFDAVTWLAIGLGAFAGGAVLHVVSPSESWLIAAVPMLLSLPIVLSLPSTRETFQSPTGEVPRSNMMKVRKLRSILVLAVLSVVTGITVQRILPDVAEVFGDSAIWLGALTAALLVGRGGFVAVATLVQRSLRMSTIAWSIPLSGALALVVAYTESHGSAVGTLVALAFLGFLLSMMFSSFLSATLGHSEPEHLSANIGMFFAVAIVAQVAMGLVAAILADALGVDTAFVIIGVSVIAVWAAIWIAHVGEGLPEHVIADESPVEPHRHKTHRF